MQVSRSAAVDPRLSTLPSPPPFKLTRMAYSPEDPTPVSVLIAPSALGEVPADDVAQRLGEGVRQIILDAAIRLSPIEKHVQGETITVPTTNSAGTLTEASYVLDSAQATAYIDAVAATGPDRLAAGTADSYGVGVLVADAQSRGVRRVVLNLAGCPVDDGGVGLLVALGANPLDQAGHTLPKGGAALAHLADFDTAHLNIGAGAVEWILLTDTDAPLDTDAPGLARLAEVTGTDPATPGLGAGGCLAVAVTWLSTLLHGSADSVRLIPEAELVAESLAASGLIGPRDLIITAGAASTALARVAGEGNVLGVVLAEGEQAPGSAAETITAEARDDLRAAGARLAADYLRISTIQG